MVWSSVVCERHRWTTMVRGNAVRSCHHRLLTQSQMTRYETTSKCTGCWLHKSRGTRRFYLPECEKPDNHINMQLKLKLHHCCCCCFTFERLRVTGAMRLEKFKHVLRLSCQRQINHLLVHRLARSGRSNLAGKLIL